MVKLTQKQLDEELKTYDDGDDPSEEVVYIDDQVKKVFGDDYDTENNEELGIGREVNEDQKNRGNTPTEPNEPLE